MIAVMQCAGTKRSSAGMFSNNSGQKIYFVGQPSVAPVSAAFLNARPDDLAEDGRSWRQHLVEYNRRSDNPYDLSTAYELYEPPTYQQLVQKLGVERVYILSAGWGLIRADFRTPTYDITFTSQVKKKAPWKYRSRTDVYHDFNHLPNDPTEEVFFFGGKDYVPLFASLTAQIAGQRTVFYNSATPPRAPGCKLQRFEATRNMNWQYDCASWFLSRV